MQHFQQPWTWVKFQFLDSSFQKFSYCLLFSTSTDSFISSFFIDVNTNLLGQKGTKLKLEWTILKLPFHHESLSHHIFSRQQGLALDQGWLQGCPLSTAWSWAGYFVIYIHQSTHCDIGLFSISLTPDFCLENILDKHHFYLISYFNTRA